VIALDTNVLARYLLKDDAAQHRAALALFGRREAFTAPVSVMQELVWVLSVNDCGRSEIAKGLRLLLGLPNFKPQDIDALLYALKWYEEGMDFDDALHLASSARCAAFATFDRPLSKRARRLGAFPPVTLL
jgi:predicted nucleic-acid-binding protein